MKKSILSAFLLFLCLGLAVPALAVNDGYSSEYSGNNTEAIVLNGGTQIYDYEYGNRSDLTNVVIPDGVEYIGAGAFLRCRNLRSIVIPDSVTYIGDGAFSGCNSLTNIDIPNGVTEIGEFVFYSCASLMNIVIPDSVTYIGDGAFCGCTGLTNIVIPDSVTYIGGGAFSGCRGLMSIDYSGSWDISISPFFRVENGILIDYIGIESNIVIPDNVTVISDSVFAGDTHLFNVVIPESVTSIGDQAFAQCSGLQSIRIPESVTSIGEEAFAQCGGLQSVYIGENVKTIGHAAFADCPHLSDVTLPKDLDIRTDVFFNTPWQTQQILKPPVCIAVGVFGVAAAMTIYRKKKEQVRIAGGVETSSPAQNPSPITAPAARFCTVCGQALQPGARFCSQCGRTLYSEENEGEK